MGPYCSLWVNNDNLPDGSFKRKLPQNLTQGKVTKQDGVYAPQILFDVMVRNTVTGNTYAAKLQLYCARCNFPAGGGKTCAPIGNDEINTILGPQAQLSEQK